MKNLSFIKNNNNFESDDYIHFFNKIILELHKKLINFIETFNGNENDFKIKFDNIIKDDFDKYLKNKNFIFIKLIIIKCLYFDYIFINPIKEKNSYRNSTNFENLGKENIIFNFPSDFFKEIFFPINIFYIADDFYERIKLDLNLDTFYSETSEEDFYIFFCNLYMNYFKAFSTV